MIACLLGALLLGPGGENRLWFVELELRGACAEVRLDCGADGETHLAGPFSSGEDRRLIVPVPVRSPLGSAGLAAVPLPLAEVLPAGAPASVRVLGWSPDQPAARLVRLAGGELDRPRPPSAHAPARPRPTELLLVLIAGGFLLRFRRRPAVCLALAFVSGFLALELARSRRPLCRVERVVDWEAGRELAVLAEAAPDELRLPSEWLEVAPEGRFLDFFLDSTSGGSNSGRARARGARLVAFQSTLAPPLTVELNGAEPLCEVWIRSQLGAWQGHGRWDPGLPLPPALSSGPSSPPGWLASALSPGRTVLLARACGGTWLRCLGFEAR